MRFGHESHRRKREDAKAQSGHEDIADGLIAESGGRIWFPMRKTLRDWLGGAP